MVISCNSHYCRRSHLEIVKFSLFATFILHIGAVSSSSSNGGDNGWSSSSNIKYGSVSSIMLVVFADSRAYIHAYIQCTNGKG